jgi:hypothetical protein
MRQERVNGIHMNRFGIRPGHVRELCMCKEGLGPVKE